MTIPADNSFNQVNFVFRAGNFLSTFRTDRISEVVLEKVIIYQDYKDAEHGDQHERNAKR